MLDCLRGKRRIKTFKLNKKMQARENLLDMNKNIHIIKV